MNIDSESVTFLGLIVTVVLAAGGAAALKAFFERKGAGADATAVVTAAARELVDPLRRELAEERRSHAAEIQEERENARALHEELKACRIEVRELRDEVRAAWKENEKLRRRVIDLEAAK